MGRSDVPLELAGRVTAELDLVVREQLLRAARSTLQDHYYYQTECTYQHAAARPPQVPSSEQSSVCGIVRKLSRKVLRNLRITVAAGGRRALGAVVSTVPLRGDEPGQRRLLARRGEVRVCCGAMV